MEATRIGALDIAVISNTAPVRTFAVHFQEERVAQEKAYKVREQWEA